MEIKSRDVSFVDEFRNEYRLLHRKCDIRIFLHELQNVGPRANAHVMWRRVFRGASEFKVRNLIK